MELVSPFIYQKIDLDKFNKKGSTNTNTISTIIYDHHSKNLVQFNEDNIKIFNNKATTMKKNLNLKLTK